MKKKLEKSLLFLKRNFMISELIEDNSGMGVIEIVLIILVLVGLVVIFRTQVTKIVNNIFVKMTTKVNSF